MTEIPGYRIRRELGHGGMATVYLAVQESLERAVALKVMAPALATDRTFTQRFVKEGKTIAKFNHPHIVGIYDVGVSNGYHYIAMEHVGGGDLKTRLRRDGASDPIEALRICKDVATALHYAHKQGFIHRDVKSENILFRDDGAAVLTDFGIAKAVDSGTKMTGTGMSIGTPHYMSPEQARGKPLDGRSDLYSLGIVLYEMLTGKVPFQAEDSVAIGIMHVSHPVPDLPDSLSTYRGILKKLLAKDPRDRYQSAQDLIKAIDDVLVASGNIIDPSTTMPSIDDETPAPRIDPKRLRVIGAMLSFGILVIALAIYVVNSGLLDRLMESEEMKTARQNRLEQPEQLPRGRAILQIVTRPEGAEVLLDGFKLGVTPFISDTLPEGKHELVISHKYFRTSREMVNLSDDTVTKRDLALFRGEGSFTVLSQPPNAVVFLNGEQQSDRTPTTLTNVPAGQHVVQVQLERYLRKEIEIEVLPKQTGRVVVELEGGDLVEVGDQWVRPEDAAEQFMRLARAAAAEGLVAETEKYVAGARSNLIAGQTLSDADQVIARARAERARRAEAQRAASDALRRAEEAIARFDKQTAIAAFREALQISPQYEAARNGLNRAEQMKVPGEVFRDSLADGSVGPELIVVASGSFEMGSNEGEPGRDPDEGPSHEVRITHPFAIGKYEVTFEEFDRFALAMGRERPRDRGWGRRRQPVINVSWNDAKDYAEWLSRVTGESYRLPSEAEWEYAARAGTRTIYWWGNVMEKNKANCDGCGTGWEEKRTTPVGSFNPNLFGLYDTAGNVFEWTEDCYNNSYTGAPVDGLPWLSGNCNRRVYRGGSWYFGPTYLRSADRAENIRSYRSSNVGFRVVRDLN